MVTAMTNSFSQLSFPVLPAARSLTKTFLRTQYAPPPLPLIGAILIGLLETASLVLTHAHAATSITETTGAGDLGTQVVLPPPGGNVYGITGGQPVGNNLYHSFAQFNVGTGDIAQFQTPTLIPDAAMLNILGRITDQNPSAIFGGIDSTTYYPSANLFLMNPHGFLFGPQAAVNVGGMVAFTTADYLRLTDNVRFEAIPGKHDALLSAFPVAAFGFLGSNPAAIAVQGSQLTVANGRGLSLVGGNQGFTYTNPDTGLSASVPDGMTMTGGTLSAPGGQINLASVASAGEVLNGTLESAPNINGNSFTAMGNITLSQGALLKVSADKVSADAAGTVRIRGGQFVITDSTLEADTANSDGALTALDIKVTGDLVISDTRGLPILTARTTGHGDAGKIQIESANLVATSSTSSLIPFALIDSHTSAAETAGRAGDINIVTGNLQASHQGDGSVVFADSGTRGLGQGHGGNVTISAQSVALQGSQIFTGDSMATLLPQDANGSAGDVTITADRVTFLLSGIDTSALLASNDAELAGSVALDAHDINLTTSSIFALGFGGGGEITVTADRLIMDATTQFQSLTASGPGSDIRVNAPVVELLNGSSMATTTVGDGQAGDIHVTATNHLTLSTSPVQPNPSGLFSNSIAVVGTGLGDAGNITVSTSRLEMTGGSRINTITLGSGSGGDVTINATNSVSISGEFPPVPLETIFGVGTTHPSGIFTGTAVGEAPCSGSCGDAGRILITTGSLTLGTGAQIDSSTRNSGDGGTISIETSGRISLSGTLNDGSPVGIFSRTIGTDPGSGAGGNIALTAGQSVTISNGASVSASSTGPGNAGNIQVDAGSQFTMTNSSVTTEATESGGGAIKITTSPSGTVHLTDSMISASVLNGAGGGGSVNIDPQFVILQNSQILANAVFGPGGNISITTNLLLPDATSVISASSQFGVNGTITIQSPNAPISGQIHPLGKSPLIATTLFTQRCAALANGQFSSFTVAGRNSLPTEPGSWLTSPLAMAGVEPRLKAEGGSVGERQVVSGEWRVGDRQMLSLRKVAPAGFLTHAFAEDRSAGCQS